MFADSANVSEEMYFKGFQVSQKKTVIRELMEYANSIVNPMAQELVRNVEEAHLMEWLDVDKNAPTAHEMTDAEIVEMLKNGGSATADSTGKDSENESDDEEVKVKKRVSIDKCFQMTMDLIEVFEQRTIFTEQEIMTVYLWKDRLIKEKPKFMKQTTVDNWLKRATSACKQSTIHHTLTCISATTNISPDVPQDQTQDVPQAETQYVLQTGTQDIP